MTNRPRATDQACLHLLRTLFDQPEQIMSELAPAGWSNSPLRLIAHPTAGQQYEESIRFHQNVSGLFGKKSEQPEPPEPRPEDFVTDPPEAGHPMDELIKLLGDCVWLIFSNNHTVYDTTGQQYDLGSFRGSGRFVADFLNAHYPPTSGAYDYLDFYCAGAFTFDRADTTPVFELLFRRVRAAGCDWEYAFPRISLVDLSGLREDTQPDDPARYNPVKAMEQQMEAGQKKAEMNRLQEKLDESYREEYEAAKYKLPPPEVRAYRNIYGQLPQGFPRV